MTQQSGSTVDVDEARLAEQIELTTDMSVVDGPALQIRYEVTNRSTEPIVLLNFVRQPMAEPEQDPDRAYVEPQSDGTVVITQRALVERVPSSKRPLHRAVLVDAGATLENEFTLALPLTYSNPEAPKAGHQVPDPLERVQLCLGFVLASRFDAVALEQVRGGADDLRPVGPALPEHQQLLRSEVHQIG
jgi:hypothetical protein